MEYWHKSTILTAKASQVGRWVNLQRTQESPEALLKYRPESQNPPLCKWTLSHSFLFLKDLGLSNFILLFQSFLKLRLQLAMQTRLDLSPSLRTLPTTGLQVCANCPASEVRIFILGTPLKFSLNLSQFWMLSWTSANGILFLSFTFISVTYLKVFILGKNFTEIKWALIK